MTNRSPVDLIGYSKDPGTAGESANNLLLGQPAIATTATDGFAKITATAGPPTGVPTADAGYVPLHYDTIAHRLHAYDGGWRPVSPKALGAQTIGTSQVAVAHGLGYAPTDVLVTMTGAGQVWKSAASDATNVYLTADAASRTADVYVR